MILDPKVRDGVSERLRPAQFSSEPWRPPVAPPVPDEVPVPTDPAPAPDRPAPAPGPAAPPAPGPTAPPAPGPTAPPAPAPTPDAVPAPGPAAPPITVAPQARAKPAPVSTARVKPMPDPEPMPDPRAGPKNAPEEEDEEPIKGPIRWVTYTKKGPDNRVYAGRSRGPASWTARQIVEARDAKHKKLNAAGYEPAAPDKDEVSVLPFEQRWFDPAYQAIRGREQQLIDKYGGAWSDNDNDPKKTHSGNTIRGVRVDHPMGEIFDEMATALYGRKAPYTGLKSGIFP